MIVRTFASPVTLIRDGSTCEIGDLWEALSYLRSLPEEERSPLWKRVLSSCESAMTGSTPAYHARQALETYLVARAMVPTHTAAEKIALAL